MDRKCKLRDEEHSSVSDNSQAMRLVYSSDRSKKGKMWKITPIIIATFRISTCTASIASAHTLAPRRPPDKAMEDRTRRLTRSAMETGERRELKKMDIPLEIPKMGKIACTPKITYDTALGPSLSTDCGALAISSLKLKATSKAVITRRLVITVGRRKSIGINTAAAVSANVCELNCDSGQK